MSGDVTTIQQPAAAPAGAGRSTPRRSRHHAGRRRGRRRRMRGRGRHPASGWTAPSAPAACPRRLSPPAASTASPSSPPRSGTAATVARSLAKSGCAASSTHAPPMSRPLGFHRSSTGGPAIACRRAPAVRPTRPCERWRRDACFVAKEVVPATVLEPWASRRLLASELGSRSSSEAGVTARPLARLLAREGST